MSHTVVRGMIHMTSHKSSLRNPDLGEKSGRFAEEGGTMATLAPTVEATSIDD